MNLTIDENDIRKSVIVAETCTQAFSLNGLIDIDVPQIVVKTSVSYQPVKMNAEPLYMFTCKVSVEWRPILSEIYEQLRQYFPLAQFVVGRFIDPEEGEDDSETFVIKITKSATGGKSPYELLEQFEEAWWFANRHRASRITIIIDG
jgi:hypothetical protein